MREVREVREDLLLCVYVCEGIFCLCAMREPLCVSVGERGKVRGRFCVRV